jgi:DNA-directed RNA polymerase specialized sigma24 family protein
MPGKDSVFLRSFEKTLSRCERFVLMLFYAEELDTSEIALVLNMSEPAVKATLDGLHSRARSVLADAAAT